MNRHNLIGKTRIFIDCQGKLTEIVITALGKGNAIHVGVNHASFFFWDVLAGSATLLNELLEQRVQRALYFLRIVLLLREEPSKRGQRRHDRQHSASPENENT